MAAFVQMVAQLARGFAKGIADRNIRVLVRMILAIVLGDLDGAAGHAQINGGVIQVAFGLAVVGRFDNHAARGDVVVDFSQLFSLFLNAGLDGI